MATFPLMTSRGFTDTLGAQTPPAGVAPPFVTVSSSSGTFFSNSVSHGPQTHSVLVPQSWTGACAKRLLLALTQPPPSRQRHKIELRTLDEANAELLRMADERGEYADMLSRYTVHGVGMSVDDGPPNGCKAINVAIRSGPVVTDDLWSNSWAREGQTTAFILLKRYPNPNAVAFKDAYDERGLQGVVALASETDPAEGPGLFVYQFVPYACSISGYETPHECGLYDPAFEGCFAIGRIVQRVQHRGASANSMEAEMSQLMKSAPGTDAYATRAQWYMLERLFPEDTDDPVGRAFVGGSAGSVELALTMSRDPYAEAVPAS